VQVQSTFQEANRSRLRALRKLLDIVLPLVGVAFIIGAMLFIRDLRGQIAVVTLGILLLEVGTWKLAHQLLPSERMYHALRVEVDQFIALVRRLNTAALQVKAHHVPEPHQALEELRATMHQVVERMVQVAGKTETELASVPKAVTTDCYSR
jgi:hypothetical protein